MGWATTTLCREDNWLCMVVLACTEYMFEHSRFLKQFSQHPCAALNFLQELSLEMWCDSKVPFCIDLPLVACACFEIKRPNMDGV